MITVHKREGVSARKKPPAKVASTRQSVSVAFAPKLSQGKSTMAMVTQSNIISRQGLHYVEVFFIAQWREGK